MLPDFPKAKAFVRSELNEWTRRQIPILSPLLNGVRKFRQHEGPQGFESLDESGDLHRMEHIEDRFDFTLTREEMRSTDLSGVQAKLLQVANEFASSQTRTMLRVAGDAAESVGNSVPVTGPLTARHFLDMLARMAIEFDPQSEKPIMPSLVVHPDTAQGLIENARTWETDPAYQQEFERIMTTKREEWLARESNRKLVD